MTIPEHVHDLRGERPAHLTGAALERVKVVRPGVAVTLLLAAEPALLMASLNLQLRENLHWDVVEADGAWRVTVRHRADVAPADVLALLAADHKRIDGLLARALSLLNHGDAAAAAPLLREFAAMLKRHVGFEDGVLAISLGADRAAADEPPGVMLREHREIAQQLALVEDVLAAAPVDVSELAVYCAILSGTLAKHEYREEHNLFPLWRMALMRRSGSERTDLLTRAQVMLAG
ncbi:MAG: hemerythrin domain-containing protein [Burkholderiales bacterium]|nr:hemerythrin domain-containing protein [Burkholderiales bacterium]MDP2400160.1 hemerythrin domain-containing protein [Burkholderiales bacterium]